MLLLFSIISSNSLCLPALYFCYYIHFCLLQQHLSDDLICLLSQTNLSDLWILQTKYTETTWPMTSQAWKEFRKNAKNKLHVHLAISGNFKSEVSI